MNHNHHTIDIIDYKPDMMSRTSKKVYNCVTDSFEERVYYTILKQEFPLAVNWLETNYGRPDYPFSLWWTVFDKIVVEEKLFTFLLLAFKK
jgi:hypothetical protein